MSAYALTFSVMPPAICPIGALADAYGAPITAGGAAPRLAAIIGAVGWRDGRAGVWREIPHPR